MIIKKLKDSTLLVPKRIEIDGFLGDSLVKIKIGDADYQKYLGEYDREQSLNWVKKFNGINRYQKIS